MLSLSVVFLAAAIALWAQPASAEDICPMGNLTQEYLYPSTPGVHYSAASCTFIDYVYLGIYDIPVNTSAIQVTVENSVVSEGSLLGVEFDGCGNYNDENGTLLQIAPVAVTIKNNLFRLNAVFYFYGCLPPNSTVTFQSNVMSANRSSYQLETSSIHFIYFSSTYSLSGASFNILDNTMTALDVNNERSIRGLYINGYYAYANSSVNIQRNTITVNGSDVYGYLIRVGELELGSNSTFRIEDNTMTVNSTYTVEAIYLYYAYGSASGLVSISRNLLNIKSEYTNEYVMYFDYFYDVNLQFDNNDISYNYDNFLYAYQFYYPSSVSISGNALDYTNATATTPFMYIYEYTFGNSTATIANNKITGPSMFTNTSLFLRVDYVSNESASIVHCGNTLPWAASPTAEQFISANLIPLLVYDADVCTVATTTLVATSTSVTTTAFGGTTTAQNMTTLDAGATTSVTTRSTTPAKSASAAAYLGHAAVACLVAVAASLL